MNNYFTKEEVHDIVDNSNKVIGVDTITYKIIKLCDTKNLTESSKYSVTVKHRILVGGSGWKIGGNYQAAGFQNYPIMMSVQSGIVDSKPLLENKNIILKRIFPKTINTNVEQSSNKSTGDSTSQAKQTSSGSSSSNVNTFGVDVSGGWFVDGPVGSVGLNYSHTWENTNSESNNFDNGHASDIQITSGNQMSVKDWSAYSSVQNLNQSDAIFKGEFIHWNWGQTYPWNIFEYSETASGSNILLPADIVARLLYSSGSDSSDSPIQNILLPPSNLSLFGLDFTMAAEWHVTFPKPLKSIETLQFQHVVNVIQGSHSFTTSGNGGKGTLVTSLTTGNTTNITQDKVMDIGQYSLVPLLEGRRNGVGIGFRSNLFDIPPTSSTSEFRIRSRGNDLLVTGIGFNSVMSAQFPSGYSGTGATLNIGFKIADVHTEYSLILKHWKGAESSNIVLNCSINDNNMAINITDLEGQGSSNNLNQLELRNFDLKSSNFHDYLVLGWNEITITILPSDTTVSSEYIISALSVEE